MLESMAAEVGLRVETVSNAKWFGYDLQAYVERLGVDVLAYTNAEIAYVSELKEFRAFHVIRDPRDIAVSAYFSHRSSHSTQYWPELPSHRAALAGMPPDEGLLRDMEFTSRLPTDGHDLRPFEAMKEWDYDRPEILELKFESLIADPVRGFSAAVDHMGFSADRATIQRAVAENSFEVLSGGRRPGEEDLAAHNRRGIPGDWIRHFGDRHHRFFDLHHPRLLSTLGYH